MTGIRDSSTDPWPDGPSAGACGGRVVPCRRYRACLVTPSTLWCLGPATTCSCSYRDPSAHDGIPMQRGRQRRRPRGQSGLDLEAR